MPINDGMESRSPEMTLHVIKTLVLSHDMDGRLKNLHNQGCVQIWVSSQYLPGAYMYIYNVGDLIGLSIGSHHIIQYNTLH